MVAVLAAHSAGAAAVGIDAAQRAAMTGSGSRWYAAMVARMR